MTRPVALDTNGYAEIARGSAAGARLRDLLAKERNRVVVLVPVVSELLQRRPDAAFQRTVLATIYEAVPPARRVAPSAADWLATGKMMATLVAAGHDATETRRCSFYLDVHVAVMCRARGIALITADSDHTRIQPHVGHHLRAFP